MIAIVVSRADSASEHIGEQLLACAEWTEHRDPDRPDADGGGTVYRRPGMELRTFDTLHIDLENPADAFGIDDGTSTGENEGDDDLDLLVFVSRHSGDTGPLLTAHFTGNFGVADYGGEAESLARAAPNAQKRILESFERDAPEGYDVGIECTHHGPTAIDVPSIFAELGSDEAQWRDSDGARAVAKAVLDLGADRDQGSETDTVPAEEPRTALPDLIGEDGRTRHVVGFGGGHYAPRFTRIVRESTWAVGHIGSDWQLAELGDPSANASVLDRAFEASAAEVALVEGTRPDLEAAIETLGYRVVSETWIRVVGDRPLPLVEALESDVATVADGLRFGVVEPDPPAPASSWRDVSAFTGDTAIDRESLEAEHGVESGDEYGVESGAEHAIESGIEHETTVPAQDAYVVLPFPQELLAEAQGIDPDETRDAVVTATIAFDTAQAGSRATRRAAFPAPAAYDDLVDDLVEILTAKYETVERTPTAVVARADAFDPELAAAADVSEGPKFGRLSAGESVEVDGRTVHPEDVHRTQEVRFDIRRHESDVTTH